ncbi:TPR-like protein [Epithele typhae]|uniref:TPR-like protein n=1 Tax=Epithele typhae TaxID=378194 RepID=UPI002008DB51|nr:TPR-like protein [Epithele typhae]KAH9944382.1 TPR-like protein [Epithele typhae]
MVYAYNAYDAPGPSFVPVGLTSAPLANISPGILVPSESYRTRLIPVLTTLLALHPHHLPAMLLLACIYYALGDFDSSIAVNDQILSIDANYVEAMNNIGTAMKAQGQIQKAFEWWWKALQVRPTFWDALDNILGMTFTLAHCASDQGRRLNYYRQAQAICQYVQTHVFDSNGRLTSRLQPIEIPRLQRAVFTSGTIYSTLGPTNIERALHEYARSLELVLRPPSPCLDSEQYSLRDLLIATCTAGHALCSDIRTVGSADFSNIFKTDISQRLDDPSLFLMKKVRAAGEQLLHPLLLAGGGLLPVPLLLPEQVSSLRTALFSGGVLPGICQVGPSGALVPPSDIIRQQANNMTSTVLLTLAKRFQDAALSNAAIPGSAGGLRISASIVILLYYIALTCDPAPSTYNNLGIMLSGISQTRSSPDGEVIDGTALARMFYTEGLHIDPKHPHLLTNLGSLVNEQGQGRPWDAVEYYYRAAKANPNLPEAVCGLANSLSSICDWRGRGALVDEIGVDDAGCHLLPARNPQAGWVTQMVAVTDEQIKDGYRQPFYRGDSLVTTTEACLRALVCGLGRHLRPDENEQWRSRFQRLAGSVNDRMVYHVNSVGFFLRFCDWIAPQLQRRWYLRTFGRTYEVRDFVDLPNNAISSQFNRPPLPKALQSPEVPSVLPFHTFTCPVSPRTVRLIPHRAALKASYAGHSHPWMPEHVFRPPRPPFNGRINLGYISNDVNNHPLSHLMQNVFGLHDRDRFNIFIYTTSPWDGTAYRPRIASMVEHCVDVSSWNLQQILQHIGEHELHILINLGGYTKGARNDIFAVRPVPIQMQLIGYAGTVGASWCDYIVCDPISCPQDLSAAERWRILQSERGDSPLPIEPLDMGADLDPEDDSELWIYSEKFMYMPHTFMVTDHKQSFRGDDGLSPETRSTIDADTLWLDEERRRACARREVFPDIPQDVIVFANFNQGIFYLWLRILRKVPRSILWLLRFPGAAEEHLRRSAALWAGKDVASRIRFTDIARKDFHIYRARVVDLFLDTVECNAHTIAADVLWTGTPMLTWPKHRHKMCSRVAASIVHATGFGAEMTVHSAEEYEARAVALAQSVSYVPHREPSGAVVPRGAGELIRLRKNLFLNRDHMPLFDTARWTRNLEKGLWEAWRRWVDGTQYECSDEWMACEGEDKRSSCIWIKDDDPVRIQRVE